MAWRSKWPRLVFADLRTGTAALSLRGRWVRRDARPYSSADQRAGAGHALDGHAGGETTVCAASAPQEEAETRARRVVAGGGAARLAAPFL